MPDAIISGGRVLNRERANGVHPALQQLLDDWELDGTHTVTVAGDPRLPPGGLRTAADQARAVAMGLTAATDLSTTPHGRGAALDIWPMGFDPFVKWENQPLEVRDLFRVFGEFAEARGFVWGGRWHSNTFPNGDQPHVEIMGWTRLLFPPPNYCMQYICV